MKRVYKIKLADSIYGYLVDENGKGPFIYNEKTGNRIYFSDYEQSVPLFK